MRRVSPLLLGLLLAGRPAAAETQIRPFIGLAFAGSTTFIDPDHAVTCPATVQPGGCRLRNVVIGGDAILMGEIFGIEADGSWAPGFFQSGPGGLVLHSGVTTLSGSVIVAAPRHLTEYTLRPYLVAGAGVMHVWLDDSLNLLPVHTNMPVMNVGIGLVGFLTNRVGLAWEVRRFGSFTDVDSPTGTTSGGPAKLSFWRASMAVTFRHR